MLSANMTLASLSGSVLPPQPADWTEERFDISANWEDIAAMPPKARGEVAEARFLAKAMEMGFVVAKPFGDSAKFDFIVQARGRLSRVQVKSAWMPFRSKGWYQFRASPRRGDAAIGPYRPDEIDFLIAYVAPEDAWYVIPVGVVLNNNHVLLWFRTDESHPMARYREAWWQLRGRRRSAKTAPKGS